MSDAYFHPRFSQTSWHRRLYVWKYRRVPFRISICRYFWSIVWAVGTLPFAAGWRALGDSWQERITLGGVGGFLVVVIGGLAYVVYLSGHWWLILLTIGITLGTVGGVFGISTFIGWLWDRRKPRPPKPSKPKLEKVKKPSILVEYLKAKKSKVCPYIQWVE